MFLAWCADLQRLDRVCNLLGQKQVSNFVENFVLATVDATLAAQTAALAAESLGLGICYIGGIRTHASQVIESLELPKLVFPITGMTLGWPAVLPPARLRLPTEAVLHWEAYRAADETLLRAFDAEMTASGSYRRRLEPGDGSADRAEVYGWMEHAACLVTKPVRRDLRMVIESQGFGFE